MNQQAEKRLLLTETAPSFASDLRQFLIEKGERELAAPVPELMILDRCRCGDDLCARFCTKPKPQGGFGPSFRSFCSVAPGFSYVSAMGSLPRSTLHVRWISSERCAVIREESTL